MDQDETTGEVVEEPTLTETKAEEAEGHDGEKPGKVIATFQARITLRLNPGDGEDRVEEAEEAVPTNATLAGLIEDIVYSNVPYFNDDAINATVEKV